MAIILEMKRLEIRIYVLPVDDSIVPVMLICCALISSRYFAIIK